MSSSIHHVIYHYIVRPLGVVLQNASVLVLFFIVVAFNFLSDNSTVDLGHLGVWAFERLPVELASLLKSPNALTLAIVAFIFQALLGVAVSQEMTAMYRGTRISLRHSLKAIQWDSFVWFLRFQILIYLIFGMMAALFYGAAFLLW